jgi:hypothetical protein
MTRRRPGREPIRPASAHDHGLSSPGCRFLPLHPEDVPARDVPFHPRPDPACPGASGPFRLSPPDAPAELVALAARTLSHCAHRFTRRHELPGVLHQGAQDRSAPHALRRYISWARPPIGMARQNSYQPSKLVIGFHSPRPLRERPALLQMQPDDHGRHNLTQAGYRTKCPGRYLADAPVAEHAPDHGRADIAGTAAADRQARSSNRPPGQSTRLRKCQPRLADPIPLAGSAPDVRTPGSSSGSEGCRIPTHQVRSLPSSMASWPTEQCAHLR